MPTGEPAPRIATSMVERVAAVGAEVARPVAPEVDAEGRFPTEALGALRGEAALGAGVPAELGGGGANLRELAAACTALGQHCAASGMILAMHHIQVVSIVRHCHGEGGAQLEDYLRSLAREQRLIASVTSEVGVGGDLRRSLAALEPAGPADAGFVLDKRATTISYAEHADDLLITARRRAEAAPGDQVLVLSRRGQHVLEDVGAWDTLGMRGTCSPPARVRTRVEAWQVLPESFADIAAHTMVLASHVLWSSCWLGIARDALAIARGAVRARARQAGTGLPPGADALAEVSLKVQTLSDAVTRTLDEFEAIERSGERARLGALAFALRVNNLKLTASRLVIEVVQDALAVVGISGYRNDTPHSLGRHLRDALSAPLMIHNARIEETNAALSVMQRGESR